jgi:hypothetical protein
MTDGTWRDRLAGHRMQVDEQFTPRINDSPLTSGEWNLVMTAVEFQVEGEGEHARLTADTSKVESVVPEFDKMRQRGPGNAGGRSEPANGLIDSVKNVLGLDSGTEDDEKLQAAIRLTDAYTQELQSHLEERGQWESIREAATGPSPE